MFRREMLRNPKYLEDKVREHLISNPHRVVQTMSPVESFTEDNQRVIDSVEEELIGQLSQVWTLTQFFSVSFL